MDGTRKSKLNLLNIYLDFLLIALQVLPALLRGLVSRPSQCILRCLYLSGGAHKT